MPVDFVVADEINEGAVTSVVDVESGIPNDKMVKKKLIVLDNKRNNNIFIGIGYRAKN